MCIISEQTGGFILLGIMLIIPVWLGILAWLKPDTSDRYSNGN